MPRRWKSDRPEHIRANLVATAAIAVAGYAIGQPIPGLIAAAACFLTEAMATPDCDLAEQRRHRKSVNQFWEHWRCSYWRLYGSMVSHRSPFSHSLLLGLSCRLLYGFWWVLLACWWLWQDGWVSGVVLLWAGQYVLLGAALSDCTHYAMDRIRLSRWLLG